MMKKIQITIDENVYGELVKSSERSLRSLATEVVYQMRRGLEISDYEMDTVKMAVHSMYGISVPDSLESNSNPKVRGYEWLDKVDISSPDLVSSGEEGEYEDIIGRISDSFERELDSEESGKLNKDIKARGLVWNQYKKTLEKPQKDGTFKIIKQF
jgi:hypothetical protein